MDVLEFPPLYQNFFTPFLPTSPIVLALSGGPDSVALGESLFRQGFSAVTVAHFHHGLRGPDSDDDQIFCSTMAKRWNWNFMTERWNSPESSEEKARLARYAFLEKVRGEKKAEAVFLAHHRDDQAETIFFQFLRGSGLKGLLGMTKWDMERKIFRPFLGISKLEILSFLQQEGLSFREDRSNADPDLFDRNYLRLQIFPLLRKRFPHFEDALLRNATLLRTLQEMIEALLAQVWQNEIRKEAGGFTFQKSAFFSWPEFLRGEVLKRAFAPKAPTFAQLKATEDFIGTAGSGKTKTLLGVKIRVYGENIFMEKIHVS